MNTCGECKWFGRQLEGLSLRVCNCDANDGEDMQRGFSCYVRADFSCPRWECKEDWADRLAERLRIIGWSSDEFAEKIRAAAKAAIDSGELKKEE